MWTSLIYLRTSYNCLKNSYEDERAKFFSAVTDNIARGSRQTAAWKVWVGETDKGFSLEG